MKKKTIYKADVDAIATAAGMDNEEVSWLNFLADETNTGHDSIDKALTAGTFYSSFREASTAAAAIVAYFALRRIQQRGSAVLGKVVQSVGDKLDVSYCNVERVLRSISGRTFFGCLILVSAKYGHHVIKLFSPADVAEHVQGFGEDETSQYLCSS